MKEFWLKHKVFISGLIVSMALAAQEFISKGDDFSWKVIAYAAFLAGLSFAAKTLRGQAATIVGVLLTALSTYATVEELGAIKWSQVFLQMAIASALALFSSPPKDAGYEKTMVISDAKADGKAITKGENAVT